MSAAVATTAAAGTTATTGSAAAADSRYDAIVVGAGLGGLSSALHLQQAGLRVAVLEKSHRIGGLCGTYRHQGRDYVIACNDFGTGLPTWLREIGVNLNFNKYQTRIFHEGRQFSLPPDLPSVLQLLPHAGDIWRYIKGQKQAKLDGYQQHKTLGGLVDTVARNGMMANLLKLPAYLMGVSPNRLRLDAMNHEYEFGYGYTQPTTPEGGPQVMADAMANKVRERGSILLDTRFEQVLDTANGWKRVKTSRGELECRHLVSAIPDESVYPDEFPRGLPLAMYWLAIDKSFVYPKKVHTCVHYPAGISQWFDALEAGHLPQRFGFHIFNSHLHSDSDCYTVNLYFYLPEGQANPDERTMQQVNQYLFTQLETMLPGISAAIRERHFVSPHTFRATHGMSSRVLPVVTPAGYAKPDNYHAETDTWRAGASFFPPGDHGSAAVLSGKMVAQRILSLHAA